MLFGYTRGLRIYVCFPNLDEPLTNDVLIEFSARTLHKAAFLMKSHYRSCHRHYSINPRFTSKQVWNSTSSKKIVAGDRDFTESLAKVVGQMGPDDKYYPVWYAFEAGNRELLDTPNQALEEAAKYAELLDPDYCMEYNLDLRIQINAMPSRRKQSSSAPPSEVPQVLSVMWNPPVITK